MPKDFQLVLRSGYVVDVDDDVPATIEHLLNAIVMENMQRLSEGEVLTEESIVEELSAEISHVAVTTAPEIVRTLFAELLFARVIERLQFIAEQAAHEVTEGGAIE